MRMNFTDLNKIRMDLLDAPKVELMTNKNNHYYEVIYFKLKNSRG